MIEAYDGLTRRERQIADLLLKHPELPVLNSASDLAQQAEVSNSTVTRFVKNLGFETYDAMRRTVRDQFGQGSPLSLMGQNAPTPAADMLDRFVQQDSEILKATFSHLDRDIVDKATDALLQAPQVGFLGMRNSSFFASYAHWQFVQFRPGTRVISGVGDTSAEHVAGFRQGDLVVIVGVRRIVPKLRVCIDILAETGVDILLIVDSSSIHLAQRARWTIVCPVENEHVFDSYSGVLSVLRLLAFITFQKAGNDGLAYMATIESHHSQLGEL